ncbi:MAG: 4Fe-4S binding protein [Gammaproteobacteria bacterium]
MPLPLQDRRFLFRSAFFLLFVVAPPLDLFRLDLHQGHFILLGLDWTLGLDPFLRGEAGPGTAALNLFLRGFLPLALLAGGLLWVAWRYGRLYCGWLCPHFSVVETINNLMFRASGKPTLWEKSPLPERQPDGRNIVPDRRYWPLAAFAVLFFAFLWAVVLLTYLLPPKEIYANLFSGELTRNQAVFIGVATLAFIVEFTLARHLFCRYGCAVGLFQSLAWMANKRAMVVGFDGSRASACASCNAACDNACPMRLKPRSIKRKMFTCTQCAQCISACTEVQAPHNAPSLLQWVEDECALQVSDREHGRPRSSGANCFRGIDVRVEKNFEPTGRQERQESFG